MILSIKCKNCKATYTGQNKNYIRVRKQQHNDVRNLKTNLPIPAHCIDNKHVYDFDNIKILDREKCDQKRLVKEMIYIKTNKNNINIQLDTVGLSNIYNSLLPL